MGSGWADAARSGAAEAGGARRLAVDVIETDDAFTFTTDVPGVSREDVKVRGSTPDPSVGTLHAVTFTASVRSWPFVRFGPMALPAHSADRCQPRPCLCLHILVALLQTHNGVLSIALSCELVVGLGASQEGGARAHHQRQPRSSGGGQGFRGRGQRRAAAAAAAAAAGRPPAPHRAPLWQLLAHF